MELLETPYIRCLVGGSIGGCGARAVSRKTPIYFISYFLSDEQFSTALNKVVQGGKLPEVARMLSDLTGRILSRQPDVYNVVNRLKKNMVNIETGQKMVEFKGVQVPAEGLGLTRFRKNSGKIV